MSERSPKRSFAARPAGPEDWIKAPERQASRGQPAEDFSARLTIDVTADMLRALFERDIPPPSGEGQ